MTTMKSLLQLAIDMSPGMSWPTYDGKELDRSQFLTSSETGSCLRKVFFDKEHGSGFNGNGYSERGKAIESWLVSKFTALEQIGYSVMFMGEDQRSFYDADLGLSGTPDGLLRVPNTGEYVLLEIKSIDPRTNKNNLPKPNHVLQVQQNLLLVSRCLGIEIPKAVLFYIDASNLFDTVEFEITLGDSVAEMLVERADLLWAAKSALDLDPTGLMTGECDMCPHTARCGAVLDETKKLIASGQRVGFFDQSEGLPLVPAVLSAEDMAVASDFLALRDVAEVAEKQLDGVKEAVKKLALLNGGSVLCGNKVITATVQGGVVTFDKEKVGALCDKAEVPVTSVQKTGSPFVKVLVTADK